MRYDLLQQNIIDQIKEAQMKLGFAKETIRLYYPYEELAFLLDTTVSQDALIDDLNQNFCSLVKDSFGNIQIVEQKKRLVISIPPEGVTYIHEHYEDSQFLKEWIAFFSANHHATVQELCKVFARFSEDYICKQMDDEDFDYVLYFKDTSVDAYCYLIKMEMGHTIYHRFSRHAYLMNGWNL